MRITNSLTLGYPQGAPLQVDCVNFNPKPKLGLSVRVASAVGTAFASAKASPLPLAIAYRQVIVSKIQNQLDNHPKHI
jgi:hypothetical protein